LRASHGFVGVKSLTPLCAVHRVLLGIAMKLRGSWKMVCTRAVRRGRVRTMGVEGGRGWKRVGGECLVTSWL